jgi:oligosaccharide repeat unit polymerase
MNFSVYFLSFSWLVSSLCFIFLLSLGIYNLVESNDFESFYYLFFCFFSLISGIFLGKRLHGRSNYIHSKKLVIWKKWKVYLVYLLCLSGFLGGIVFYSVTSSSVGIGNLDSLSEQRQNYLSSAKVSSLSNYIIQYGGSLGIIGGICLPWVSEKNKNNFLKFSVLFLYLIGYLASGLATGGRINIFVGYLPLLISFAVRHKVYFLKNKINCIIVLLISFILTMLFAGLWNMYRAASLDTLISGYEINRIYTLLQELNLTTGNSEFDMTMSFIVNSVFGNFSNGIFNFEPTYLSYSPHPLFGQYQLNYISSIINNFRGNPNLDWMYWKEELMSVYRQYGRFDNVWGTFVREFFMDFGMWATPIACFLVGDIVAYFEKYCFDSIELYILYVLSLSWLIWSIFYSLFIYRNFQIAFLLTIIFWVCKSLSFKNINTRNSHHTKSHRHM